MLGYFLILIPIGIIVAIKLKPNFQQKYTPVAVVMLFAVLALALSLLLGRGLGQAAGREVGTETYSTETLTLFPLVKVTPFNKDDVYLSEGEKDYIFSTASSLSRTLKSETTVRFSNTETAKIEIKHIRIKSPIIRLFFLYEDTRYIITVPANSVMTVN